MSSVNREEVRMIDRIDASPKATGLPEYLQAAAMNALETRTVKEAAHYYG